jgi:phage shock protein PspC (stress-responsive transcriptional regulator)
MSQGPIVPIPKVLARPRDGGIVAGVCAGIGNYFGIDPTLVRLAWAFLAIFLGAGIGLYLILWTVMPDEDGHRTWLPLAALVVCAVLSGCCVVFNVPFMALGGR